MDWGRFKAYKKVIGIDPGGYELGLSFFENGVLQTTQTLFQDEKESADRRYSFYKRIYPIIRNADLVICEEPFLRGSANINMQRMLGVIEYVTHKNVGFINPMTVKKFMGSGSFDKIEVANGSKLFLSEVEGKIINELIRDEKWNETDAVAVVLAWIMKQLEGKLLWPIKLKQRLKRTGPKEKWLEG